MLSVLEDLPDIAKKMLKGFSNSHTLKFVVPQGRENVNIKVEVAGILKKIPSKKI